MSKITLLILLIIFISSIVYGGESNTYIRLHDTLSYDLSMAEDIIRSAGGKMKHQFPPDEIICYLPEVDFSRIETVLDCSIEGINSGRLTSWNDKIGYFCWDSLIYSGNKGSVEFANENRYEEFKCGFETIIVEDSSMQETRVPTTPAGERVTNNFMIGRIAVGILLMESNGDGENWTQWQEKKAIFEAVEAYEWLSKKAEQENVDVNWVYEIHTGVPTPEEPILTFYPYITGFPTFNWMFGWIDDALAYLDVDEEWDGIFEYAKRLRADYNTNWAFALFIIKNDNTWAFPNGASGYTVWYKPLPTSDFIRPPFAVSTYRFGFYGADGGDKVIRHESSHVFGAMDEKIGSAYCESSGDCNSLGGYLQYENQNCNYCPSSGVPCYMDRAIEHGPCEHTKGQIGWIDTDANGGPDPINPMTVSIWSQFSPVEPGDIVRIFDQAMTFINAIPCTENNVAYYNDVGYIPWDGYTYDNYYCPYSVYVAVINTDPEYAFIPVFSDPYQSPIISNFTYENDSLTWDLANRHAFLTCDIVEVEMDTTWYMCEQWLIPDEICMYWNIVPEGPADSFSVDVIGTVDTIMSRPIWNKAYTGGHSGIDMSLFECSDCVVTIKGWWVNGATSASESILFRTYICGDANSDGDINILDVVFLIDYKYKGDVPPVPLQSGNVDCQSGINILDIVYLSNHLYKGGQAPCCDACCY